MDTRESLARELAEERMSDTIESCQQGGVPYKDIKLEDFMEEALQFVDRCNKGIDKASKIFIMNNYLLALEYGYKACEQGKNIEKAKQDFKIAIDKL